ncbi:PREDICTED: uncharacterized protein LOC105557646 isoform X2 [Vollenhovia emeryi]|uniref:uncharacterized protein LOC105557646 isoform X2 n=1 Tax=Vollenhovia emeryi TaxID=411798 RepID=UPI0005F41576|nr:PREDICTED: uncharacterized protein LOC105557646 isoform X2 [Vollenhovia emeryi]
MKEDDDVGLCESISDVDTIDESDNDKSIVYKNLEGSDNSETIKRESSVSKSGSSYTVANGSFANVGAEDNGDSTAICHPFEFRSRSQ